MSVCLELADADLVWMLFAMFCYMHFNNAMLCYMHSIGLCMEIVSPGMPQVLYSSSTSCNNIAIKKQFRPLETIGLIEKEMIV